MVKSFSPEIIDVAKKIGRFYLEKNDNDYERAQDEIAKVKFQKLELTDKLNISVGRPGLFIGKRGENIDAIERYLGLKIHIEESILIEDWIMPEKYHDEIDHPDPGPDYNPYNYDVSDSDFGIADDYRAMEEYDRQREEYDRQRDL